MKFKNTTDGYILLQEYVSNDNYIYAEVYGVPDDVDVRMSSEPVFTGYSSSKWTTYYTREEDGKVVAREQWNTSYQALFENGKTVPTHEVPVAEVNGDYFGPSSSTIEHAALRLVSTRQRLLTPFGPRGRAALQPSSRLSVRRRPERLPESG